MMKTAPTPPKGTPKPKYAVVYVLANGYKVTDVHGHGSMAREGVIYAAKSWSKSREAYPIAITSRGQRVRIGAVK